jgi:soluble P-type ATPase
VHAQVQVQAAAASTDEWAEVRELAAQLGLTDADRKALFARHHKDRDAILAELRERYARETSDDVIIESASPALTTADDAPASGASRLEDAAAVVGRRGN